MPRHRLCANKTLHKSGERPLRQPPSASPQAIRTYEKSGERKCSYYPVIGTFFLGAGNFRLLQPKGRFAVKNAPFKSGASHFYCVIEPLPLCRHLQSGAICVMMKVLGRIAGRYRLTGRPYERKNVSITRLCEKWVVIA